MTRPYIDNSNQGLGGILGLGARNNNLSRNVISSSKLGLPRTPSAQINQHKVPTPVADNKSDSWSLGKMWDDTKKTVWGSPVHSLGRDATGAFDTGVLTLEQWQDFGKAGGHIGANGQLYNADGSAFDLSTIGGDASKLGKATEGGLGELFTVDSLKTAGEAAKNVGQVFNMYQAADNIFGQGAKSRREAERQAKQAFEQNYAMNKMTMDKFREDNENFKQQRAAITASY